MHFFIPILSKEWGCKVMRLSPMRHRLTIEDRVDLSNGAGGVSRQWHARFQIWGAIETIDATQYSEAAQTGQRLTHRVLLRYRDDIDTTQRFRKGQSIFNIRGIRDPDGRKRLLICFCEELKP
jgi:SPP1 family predicted phage head-tail adaptor